MTSPFLSKKIVRGGALIAAACLLSPSPAFADEPMSEAAQELFAKASKARDDKDFGACFANGKAAWAVRPHWRIAGLAGDCAFELNKFVDAATFYDYFERNKNPDKLTPELMQLITERFGKAKAEVGTLTITVAPDGARVLVDGALVDVKSPVYVEPGQHTIEASRQGFATKSQDEQLAAGAEATIDLTLEKATDGTEIAPPPPPPNGEEGDRQVWPLWTFGGLAIVGLGVGITGFVVGGSAKSSGDDKADAAEAAGQGCDATCQADIQDDYDRSDTFNTVGAIGLIGAGVMAVTGVTLHFVLPRDEPESASGMWIAPTLGGAVVGGQF